MEARLIIQEGASPKAIIAAASWFIELANAVEGSGEPEFVHLYEAVTLTVFGHTSPEGVVAGSYSGLSSGFTEEFTLGSEGQLVSSEETGLAHFDNAVQRYLPLD